MNQLTDVSLSKAEKRQNIDERIAMWDDPEWDEEGYGQPLRYPDEDLVYSNLNSQWYSHEQQSIESRPIKKRKLNPINNEDDDDDEYYSPLSLFSPPPSPSDIIISQNSDFSYLPSSLDSLDQYFHLPLNSLDHYLHSNDELSNDNPFLKLDQQYNENSKDDQQEIQTVKKREENIKCDVEKQFEHAEEYGHAVPEHRIYCRYIDNQIFKAPRQSIDNTSLKKRRLVETQLYC